MIFLHEFKKRLNLLLQTNAKNKVNIERQTHPPPPSHTPSPEQKETSEFNAKLKRPPNSYNNPLHYLSITTQRLGRSKENEVKQIVLILQMVEYYLKTCEKGKNKRKQLSSQAKGHPVRRKWLQLFVV